MNKDRKCKRLLKRTAVIGAVLLTLGHACFAAGDPDLLAGWPKQTDGEIYSSPALADLDPAYPGLEIVIGAVQGTDDSITGGGVYAWHADGTNVSGWPKITAEGIVASPAVFDLDPDYAGLEVVVGSLLAGVEQITGGKVYAWHADGTDVSGWPKTTNGGVIASAVAADLDPSYPGTEILISSLTFEWPAGAQLPTVMNSTLYIWHQDGTDMSGWPFTVDDEALLATHAVGDLDQDGVLEIVIGTFDLVFFPGFDADLPVGGVIAFHADKTVLNGWPQIVDFSFASASPAIGDLDPAYPGLEVVAGFSGFDLSTGAENGSVHAWHQDGTTFGFWPRSVGNWMETSPAIADIDSSGSGVEVLIGAEDHKVYAWRRNGASVPNWPQMTGGGVGSSPAVLDLDPAFAGLEIIAGSDDGKVYAWHRDGTLVPGWPKSTGGAVESSPSVADIDGNGTLEVVAGSMDKNVYVWTVPGSAGAVDKRPWPMYRQNLNRTGFYSVPDPVAFVAIANGAGPSSDTFISPQADFVPFDAFEIQFSEPVDLMLGSAVSTSGIAPAVSNLADLGSGNHEVRLDGPISPAHWTKVNLTVLSKQTGAGTNVNVWIAHLPCDVNQDRQVNLNDATAYGLEWRGRRQKERLDLDGDGLVTDADPDTFRSQWLGQAGASRRWSGRGLPEKL